MVGDQGITHAAGQVPIHSEFTVDPSPQQTASPSGGSAPDVSRNADTDPESAAQALVASVFAALHGGLSPEKALSEIAAKMQQTGIGVHAAVFFGASATKTESLPGTPLYCHHSLTEDHLTEQVARWSKTLREVAAEAIAERRFASGVIRIGDARMLAIGNPILCQGEVVGVLGLVGDAAASRSLAQTINVVSGAVAHWWKTARCRPSNVTPRRDTSLDKDAVSSLGAAEERTVNDAEPSASRSHADFVTTLVRQPDLDAAARAFADYLGNAFGFEKVFVAVGRHGESVNVAAISGVRTFSHKAPLLTAVEETLSEAIIRNVVSVTDTRSGGEAATSGCREVARLCNQPIVVSGPFADGDLTWGAWAGVRSAEPSDATRDGIEALVSVAAPCLRLFELARGGRLTNLLRTGREAVKTRKGLLFGLAFALLAMLIPYPYRVKCDCELQPVTRRFVPVPYDGVLQDVFVEPGDEITVGQVLARMDGREIGWELTSAQADYKQAAKQYDGDLAMRDAAAAQVAKLEMERLKVQIDLLEDRTRNLEVKSPIDGVVIGGDPIKKKGARLTQGDTLFEAGPLSKMVAEVLVPDNEISRVQVGQPVSMRLDAYPSDPWKGQIVRISPSAEVRDQANVFVAEFEIENPKHVLRPGMRGRTRITTSWRPVGWNLFHKAWEQMVYGWGW